MGEDFCCDPAREIFVDGGGNPDCWDATHTFDQCCAGGEPSLGITAAAALEPANLPRWPPRTLLALLGSAGPLARFAGFQVASGGRLVLEENVGQTPWFPVRLSTASATREATDLYSKGSLCLLELADKEQAAAPDHASMERSALTSSRWFAAGSNCRPFLHCPLWAPLAAAVMDRAASMSLLHWLAALDGRPRRTKPSSADRSGRQVFEVSARDRLTLWEQWESLATAYANGGVPGLVRDWLSPEFRAVGLNARQSRNASTWSLLGSHHIGVRGRRIHLPSHLCFTCCSQGIDRLRVVFVRNPFARLVSFFRMAWLGNPLKPLNRWEDFPAFARRASAGRRQIAGSVATLSQQGFSDEDWLHTRSMSDWLQDGQSMNGSVQSTIFNVVHVEHLQDEIQELERLLCTDFAFCAPLPEFPRVNSFSLGVSSDIWSQCWSDQDVVWLVHERYKHDFDWFGYSSDPLLKPGVAKGMTRLEMHNS